MKLNDKIIHKPVTLKRTIFICLILFILLLCSAIASLLIGETKITLPLLFSSLANNNESDVIKRVFFDIRLPRVLLAIVVGGGLSISGAVFQAMLRNPLAEPYILGVSSGASVGTLIAMMLGFNIWFIGTPVFAFIGSIIVVTLVYYLGRRYGVLDTNTMLLSGVMVGSFLNAIVLFLISFIGQPVRNALIWLLGNLSNADAKSVFVIMPIIIIVSILLYLNASKLNLIASGDEFAKQLGVKVEKIKKIIYVLASIIIGCSVSLSGAIGFVGLIIPHTCRLLFGPDHRILLTTSFLLGSIFVLFMDLLSRTLLYPIELPVGALTAVIGAPVFIFLLRRK